MDKYGMPPHAATIQKMANLLLAECSKSASIPTTIGRNWVQQFIKHHKKLQSRYNCKYNY